LQPSSLPTDLSRRRNASSPLAGALFFARADTVVRGGRASRRVRVQGSAETCPPVPAPAGSEQREGVRSPARSGAPGRCIGLRPRWRQSAEGAGIATQAPSSELRHEIQHRLNSSGPDRRCAGLMNSRGECRMLVGGPLRRVAKLALWATEVVRVPIIALPRAAARAFGDWISATMRVSSLTAPGRAIASR
jgi:hypothetical protein